MKEFFAMNDIMGQSQVMYRAFGRFTNQGFYNEYAINSDDGENAPRMKQWAEKGRIGRSRPRTELLQTNLGFFAGGSEFFRDPEYDFGLKKDLGGGGNPVKREQDNNKAETKRKRGNESFSSREKKKPKPNTKSEQLGDFTATRRSKKRTFS